MTKQDLINKIAEKANLTKANAGRAVDAFIDAITEAMVEGETVGLTGFGKFHVVETKGGTKHNPKNGQPIQVAPGRKVKFKPGSGLKLP